MSSVYSHRPMAGQGPPPPLGGGGGGQPRLADAFDIITREFDALAQETSAIRAQRDELEAKINSQVNELNLIRSSLYELEGQHGKVRERYEEELRTLRTQLDAVRAEQYEREREQRERDMAERKPEREPAPAGPGGAGGPQTLPPLGLLTRPKRSESDVMAPSSRASDRPLTGGPPLPPAGGPGLPAPRAHSPEDYPMDGPLPPAVSASRGPAAAREDAAADAAGGGPIDLETADPNLRRDGSDWFAVWSARAPRRVRDVQLVHSLAHNSIVCSVRFSRDGRFLATGCNRVAQIFDVKTGEKICELIDDQVPHDREDLYIRSVCFSPDGKFLATGAEDRRIRIWDVAKRRIARIFDGHEQEVLSLQFSADGRLLVSGSGDRTARVWDMSPEGASSGSGGGGGGSSSGLNRKLVVEAGPETGDAGVMSVAISADGRLVAAGSLDAMVRLWDVQTGQLLEKLRGHADAVYAVAFTPDGAGLVSGSLDKTLKHWDIRGAARVSRDGAQAIQAFAAARRENRVEDRASVCTRTFAGHKDFVLSIAVSTDGNWVVSGSKDRGVQFWDARTGAPQLVLQGHKNSVISVDLCSPANVLASGSGDGNARIWSYSV